MRRIACAVLVLSAVGVPAGASHEPEYPKPLRFDALPCAGTCTYNHAFRDGWSLDDSLDEWLDRIFPSEQWSHEAAFRRACATPFPIGSFDDEVVQAPHWATWLFVEIRPEMDWDLFLCGIDGSYISNAANIIGQACPGGYPESFGPLGCRERIAIRVHPLRNYVIRAYNWLDLLPLRGSYTFWDRLPWE